MYENLSIQDYLKKMEEWDNKRNIATQDWIDENWVKGETITCGNGMVIQYKDFRGDLNGISKN